MACKAAKETDASSDEEELFSYLEKVQEVKEIEEIGCKKINNELKGNNSNDAKGDKNAEKNNAAKLESCGSPKKSSFGSTMIHLFKKDKMLKDKKKMKRHKCEESKCSSLDDKERDNKETKGSYHSGSDPSTDCMIEEEVIVLNDTADNLDVSEQKVTTHTSNNQLPVHKSVSLNEDRSSLNEEGSRLNEEESNGDIILGQNSEIHSKQIDSSDCIQSVDFKQEPDTTASKNDRYYLLNEKDWLYIWGKLSNKVDCAGAVHPVIQESKTSPFKGQTIVPETLVQSTNSNTHGLAVHDSEGDQISKSSPQKITGKTALGTPKVEIVYITLDETQMPSCKGEAIKKLDFSENMKHDDVSMGLNGKNCVNEENGVIYKRQNLSQQTVTRSDLPGMINEQEPFVPSYIPEGKSSLNTVGNPGKRVRFVRINDKLTRVYEDIVEEAVDLYNANGSDITGEAELFEKEQSDVQEGYNVDESFNFNDSQLIAFPINAVDVENMIKDDSMAMLTPSKLDMLSPSKLDMITPPKLELLTPSKLSELEDENDKSVDTSFASPVANTAVFLNTTSLSDGKVENESTIVLKVTRSGELVECRSNENSPTKKVAEPESPMTDTERRSRNRNSSIRKLWKDVIPEQNLKKRSKHISAVPIIEETGTETIEISSDKELSSDEDELKLYFSHKIHSKNKAIMTEHIAQTNNASDKQNCSISIQASFTESSDESAGEEIPKEKENNNLESSRNNSKQSRKELLEIKRSHRVGRKSNAESSCVVNPSLKDRNTNLKQKAENVKNAEREGTTVDKMTATKICVDSLSSKQTRKRNKTQKGSCLTIQEKCPEKTENASSVEENFPRKKKGNTQIRDFFKDTDYKQVDFEDLEDAVMNKSKNKESSKQFRRDELEEVKECRKKQNSLNSGYDKESVKEQKKPPKSKKLKKFEKRQNKDAEKINQKTSEKRLCLEKAKNTKETEIKAKNRSETDILTKVSTETALKREDIDSNMFNEEGQNKIEFLEKLFHIKLKEATSNNSISAVCKNKTQKAFIDTITEENNDRVAIQNIRGKRRYSGAKGNAKQPLKLPNASTCKRMKGVSVPDLPREVARDSLHSNSENKDVSDNTSNVTAKEKSVTLNEKRSRKNVRQVSYEVSKKKKPKKFELADSGVSPVNCLVSTQGIENFVEKELEEDPENICSGSGHKSEEGKVLDLKRKGGKPKNCNLLTHKEGCSEEVSVMNDTSSDVKTVYRKKLVPKRKGLKKINHESVIHELHKETSKIPVSTPDSSVGKEPMKTRRTKLVKGISKNVPKITSHNNDKKQNVTSLDSLEKLNDSLVQMSKRSDRNTKAKKSAENKQGKTKLAKDRVKKNSHNSAGLNDTLFLDTEHSVKLDRSETFCEICGCSISSRLLKRKKRNNQYEIKYKSDIQNICKQCLENRKLIQTKETSLEEKHDLQKGELKSRKSEDQDDLTSNVAKFESLHQKGKKSMKTEFRKRKKLEVDTVSKNISQKKRSKAHENINAPASAERENEPGYCSHTVSGKIPVKESQQDNDETLGVNSEDMPLDLSLSKVKDHNITDESVDKNQQQTTLPLPRKLRLGKKLKQCSSMKGNSLKNLKSVKKPPSAERLKSKKLEKIVWKEKLEDGAFKFDFDERKEEIHKPVNVRRMIRDILESVKGTNVKKDKKSNHSNRKGEIKKRKGNNDTKVEQRVTSESEDAWLSDSGPSSSFPAFKFSVTCDNAGKSEFHMVDINFDNKEVEISNRNENVETGVKESGSISNLKESPFVKLKTACDKETIELHNSPLKDFHKQTSKGENSKSVGNSKDPGSSVQSVEHSEDNQEVKKNVDKLRALLNKVNEKKVVKHLKFADTVGSSDSEH